MQLTINIDDNQHKTMQITNKKIIIINIINLQLIKIMINTKQCYVQLMEIIMELQMNVDNN